MVGFISGVVSDWMIFTLLGHLSEYKTGLKQVLNIKQTYYILQTYYTHTSVYQISSTSTLLSYIIQHFKYYLKSLKFTTALADLIPRNSPTRKPFDMAQQTTHAVQNSCT